jgi:hypothetical protein
MPSDVPHGVIIPCVVAPRQTAKRVNPNIGILIGQFITKVELFLREMK